MPSKHEVVGSNPARGAWLLNQFADLPPLATYTLGGQDHTIGLIIIGFALFELLPALSKPTFDRKYLPLGGLLSGFFAGAMLILVGTGMAKGLL